MAKLTIRPLRKLLRRTAPAVVAFLFTATLSRRARIPAPVALLTSALTATLTTTLARRTSDARAPSTDWLDAIQAIAKIVAVFSDGLSRPSRNIFLDASLQRLLHGHHSVRSKRAARLCPKTESDLLHAARTYLDFALAPYGFFLLKIFGVIDPQYNFLLEGARAIDVAKYMLRLNDGDVLVHQLDGERIGFPRYFAAVHHPTSTVVVSIRGTNSVSDLITDLLCGNASFCNGYAHSGMLSAAREIFTDCLSAVSKAVTETGYRVVVTGHSLGAGVGVLLTKMLLLNGLQTECFAFAAPPVFGPKHAIDAKWSDAVKAFVNDDDLVSRLCFASAKYLAREMDALAGVGDGGAKRSLLEAGDAVRVRDAVQELPSVEHTKGFEALSQTARVVRWLLPKGERARGDFRNLPPAYVPNMRYECFNVPSELFDEILVTASCFSVHMVSSYTGSFSGLGLPKREKLPPPLREDFGKVWYSNELG